MDYRTVRNYPFDENGNYEYEWLELPQIEGDFESWKQKNILFRAIVIPDRGEKFDIDPEVFVSGPRMNADFFYLEGVYVYPNKKTVVTGNLLSSKAYQNFYVDVDSV